MELIALLLIAGMIFLFLQNKSDLYRIKKYDTPQNKKFRFMLQVAEDFKKENEAHIGLYVDDFIKHFSKRSFYERAAYHDDESRPWIYFLREMGNEHHLWEEVERFSRHYFTYNIPDKGLVPIEDDWKTLFNLM